MKKIKKIVEKLYKVNAFISGNYVTKIREIDYKGICNINELLGEIIKEFRNELEGKKK